MDIVWAIISITVSVIALIGAGLIIFMPSNNKREDVVPMRICLAIFLFSWLWPLVIPAAAIYFLYRAGRLAAGKVD